MKYWIIFGLLISSFTLSAQSAKNVQLLGQLSYQQELSDIWGYAAPDGKEYALVGVFDGFSVVDVSNPAQPDEKFFVQGPQTIWRDVKVWDGYAYVTNENQNGGGLLIANLNHLPDSMPVSYWTGSGNVQFQSAHNIFIDEKGYGYIVGADYGRGGAIVVDLFTTPGQPILKTVYDQAYIHDIFVRGDTMWTAEIYRGWFAAVDISDKSTATVPASKVMATQNTPFNFTHNLWLSDDGTVLYTTDERSNAPIAAYDVSDLSNIQYLDEVRSNPGSGVIPHNSFVDGDFVVTAYYRDGLQVVDASVPDNLVETGYYDSSPLVGDGFNGAWGVYPYLPSGNYLVTDIEEGLFVLSPDFIYAARLTGVVTDSVTGAPVQGAAVEVTQANNNAVEQTSLLGQYKTGFADSGVVDIKVSKVGYEDKTITGVQLTNGSTVVADIELVPLPTFAWSGTVLHAYTNQPVENATVQLVSEDTTFTASTDANGDFTFPAVFTADYLIRIGKWSFRTRELDINVGAGQDLTFLLTPGYYDDFVMDFGWTVQSTATSGVWERAIPKGTNLNPNVLIQTDADVDTDIGEACFVTGNAGEGIGDDDIDNGVTQLSSPIFDVSGMVQPTIAFQYWYISAFGAGNPNDSLVAVLDNGTQQAVVVIATPVNPQNSWNSFEIDIAQYVNPTASMTITFIAEDQAPGHVVEAAIDQWEVYDKTALPVAAFDGISLEGCAPLTAHFFDISADQVTAWLWLAPGSNEGSSNQRNASFSFDQPGQYDITLVATNAVGKDTLERVAYVHALSGPEVTVDNSGSTGGTDGTAWVEIVNGTPPYSYQWSDPAQQTTDTATGLTPGWYYVTITDGNGCITQDSTEVQLSTGVYSDAQELDLRILPNPFANHAFLQWSQPTQEEMQVAIFGVTGQQIARATLSAGTQQWAIPRLPQAGLYLVEVITTNQRYTLRLIFTP